MGKALRSLWRDRRGNIAVMFALVLLPTLGLAGAAIDYSRASSMRTRMNNAADAAALTAAKEKPNTNADQRKDLAKQVFSGNLGADQSLSDINLQLKDIDGGVQVSVTAKLKNSFMSALGIPVTDLSVTSEAVVGGGNMEIALVLDNTGSMQNDMSSLKDAANSFVDSVMTGGGTKISIVPFVAAVNPGVANIPTAMIDVNADVVWNGMSFRGPRIAYMTNCNPDWGSGGGGTYTGPGGSGGNEGQKTELDDATRVGPLKRLADIAVELFGISQAHADVTPNTKPPVTGTTFTPADVTGAGSALLPTGFKYIGNCALGFPDKISNYDIYRRMAGATWKGCVEARAEPYDVTDDAPDPANPNTLFVQYLWPDEFDYMPYANNYMNDYPSNGSWPSGWNTGWDWDAPGNLFKFDGINPASVKENGPDTLGPNKSCPDEVLPLTNDRTKVKDKISKLNYWYNGGTIISEGVMWGWRALSPTPPFTEGAAYGSVEKVIVLMSDGANELNSNIPTGYRASDYTAYGYLKEQPWGRFPAFDFGVAAKYLDERTQLACQNAKDKGIKIYTILFRETGSAAKSLMQSCATSPSMAFTAANGAELKTVFTRIGSDASNLRVSK